MELGLKRGEVKLHTYTNEWENEFLRVKQEILESISIDANRVEHIGSTAVKGMSAKPILDMVVGVDDIEQVDPAIFEAFKKIGFLRLRVERPNELVLAKFTDGTYEVKTHYIHLVDYEKDLWKNLIFFRDYLNANEAAREQYQTIKRHFLEKESGGIVEYTDYKEQFVKEIYRKRE